VEWDLSEILIQLVSQHYICIMTSMYDGRPKAWNNVDC